MTPSSIRSALMDLAKTHDVRILWACESGSRAWGFASPDSDYDGRFVFVHPRRKYLSPWLPAEEIRADLPGDLDFSGWDLAKAIRLASKSNISLLEWLQSPIVYEQAPGFRDAMFPLASGLFRPKEGLRNYLGTAKAASKSFEADGRIRIKKLFYILRPLLAARWIALSRTLPPMAFEELLAPLSRSDDQTLLESIRRLEAAKAAAKEGELHAPEPLLLDFLHAEEERCRKAYEAMEDEAGEDRATSEAFFLKALETWG